MPRRTTLRNLHRVNLSWTMRFLLVIRHIRDITYNFVGLFS